MTGVEFIRSIDTSSQGCILWPYGMKGKYGAVWYNGKQHGAHRVSLIIHCSDAPSPDHYACHNPIACGNPACINPNHLRWDTAHGNTYDRIISGTWPGGFNNANCKLGRDQIIDIRNSKLTYRELCEIHGISKTTVHVIKTGKRWAHVR